jgi:hypothetical protein
MLILAWRILNLGKPTTTLLLGLQSRTHSRFILDLITNSPVFSWQAE